MLGNGQHVAVSALVLCAALLSIEFFDEPPSTTDLPASLAVVPDVDDRKKAGVQKKFYFI